MKMGRGYCSGAFLDTDTTIDEFYRSGAKTIKSFSITSKTDLEKIHAIAEKIYTSKVTIGSHGYDGMELQTYVHNKFKRSRFGEPDEDFKSLYRLIVQYMPSKIDMDCNYDHGKEHAYIEL